MCTHHCTVNNRIGNRWSCCIYAPQNIFHSFILLNLNNYNLLPIPNPNRHYTHINYTDHKNKN